MAAALAAIVRVVVFPVRGRVWAFHSEPQGVHLTTPAAASSLRELWRAVSEQKSAGAKAELAVEYTAQQMHDQWTKLGAAPEKSIRKRIYNAGLTLLSRITPSETFLKNIPKTTSTVEIVYPFSLNPQLVRRRVRHIAIGGSKFHKNKYYASAALLPFTSLLGILPVPNLPFFWNLFRTHAHWSALRGSETLLRLVTTPNVKQRSLTNHGGVAELPLILTPSQTLEKLVTASEHGTESLSDEVLASICEKYNLNLEHVKRWRDQKLT